MVCCALTTQRRVSLGATRMQARLLGVLICYKELAARKDQGLLAPGRLAIWVAKSRRRGFQRWGADLLPPGRIGGRSR